MKTNKNSKDIEEFLDDIFKDVEEWDKTESDEEELDLDIDDELENIKTDDEQDILIMKLAESSQSLVYYRTLGSHLISLSSSRKTDGGSPR